MIRGTTPTFTITINGAKVSSLGVIYVTLKQGTVQYDLTPTVVDDSTISVTLTQAQTLSFVAGTYAYIQVRAANTSGVAVATYQKSEPVYDILKDGEISAI